MKDWHIGLRCYHVKDCVLDNFGRASYTVWVISCIPLHISGAFCRVRDIEESRSAL